MAYAEIVFTWCPKCGSHALGSQRPGVLACSACGMRLFLNVASAVAAVLRDARGRMLVVRRAADPGRGLLDIPGGFVDPGESGEEAIRREMREELGLVLTDVRLIVTSPNEYEFEGITYRTLDLFFECTAAAPAAAVAREEIEEILFVDPRDLKPEQLAFDSVRRILPVLGRLTVP